MKPGVAALPCCSRVPPQGRAWCNRAHHVRCALSSARAESLLKGESTGSLSAKINRERVLKCIHDLKTALQRARLFYYCFLLASVSRGVFTHIEHACEMLLNAMSRQVIHATEPSAGERGWSRPELAYPVPSPANRRVNTAPARTLIRLQQERSPLKDKLAFDELLRNF